MRVVDTLFAHIWASHKKLTIILVCEWIMLVFYGLMAYFYMADFIQQMINQSLVITKDSDLFKLWQDPPVQPEMRVFLFNYTNVEEWLNGTDEKLNVEELGPYVYQEIWRKKNITFHE